MRVRSLTTSGMERFRGYLGDLKDNAGLLPPLGLLDSGEFSEAIDGAPKIERVELKTKREAAEYLSSALHPLHGPAIMRDAGLWSWLALFLFDEVCPGPARKPRAESHYILDAHNFRRRYRHLLATPYRIIKEIPDHNRIFLNAPLPVHGDLIEQTMSKLYLIRQPAVRELIDRLYYDKSAGKAKRGILPTRAKKGDLRNRLPIRLRQLGPTYDLPSLNGDQLLELLGAEFAAWLAA